MIGKDAKWKIGKLLHARLKRCCVKCWKESCYASDWKSCWSMTIVTYWKASTHKICKLLHKILERNLLWKRLEKLLDNKCNSILESWLAKDWKADVHEIGNKDYARAIVKASRAWAWLPTVKLLSKRSEIRCALYWKESFFASDYKSLWSMTKTTYWKVALQNIGKLMHERLEELL